MKLFNVDGIKKLFLGTPEEIEAREAAERKEAEQYRKQKAEAEERERVKKEEAEERARVKKEEAEERERVKKFAQSPAGMARAARVAGARTFQISLKLSETRSTATPLIGGTSSKTTRYQHDTAIDSIEAEGWRLEHANYVYRILGSVTSKEVFAKGLQEAIQGEIVGIYIFRIFN